MLQGVARIIGLAALVLGGTVGLWLYQHRSTTEQQIEELQEQKRVLERVVQRLSEEKRVADVLVTNQQIIDGVPHTTLLFVEYARDGRPLPARSLEVIGEHAHIDAMVIKFERHFIADGDPLRGHSIALFTRIYGDAQAPAEGAAIDEPGRIPLIYRGADPRVSEYEQELWQNFWRLAEDANYRADNGVRVAHGQGVWGPFRPEMLYTITLESDGGLSVVSEPLRGIYSEALRRRNSPTTVPAHQ